MYTTSAQLITAFTEQELIQLTDRENIGIIDDVVLSAAIAQADRLIDGYISPPYDLPLPQMLIDDSSLPEMAGYIVRKNIFKNGPTENVMDDYKMALAWLRDVQSGKVSLGEQDTQTQSQGRTVFKTGVSQHDWEGY